MKIFSIDQIRDLDSYTILHEPISSIDLMERAAHAFVEQFRKEYPKVTEPIHIFCGPGNNGGDGLAIARLLYQVNYAIEIYTLCTPEKASNDCAFNLERINELHLPNTNIRTIDDFPKVIKGIVIDAIFGSGLNRPIEGLIAHVIQSINRSECPIISVDIPSGIFADKPSNDVAIVSNKVYTFQAPKLAFMMAENDTNIGDWKSLDIKLYPQRIAELKSPNEYLTFNSAQQLYQKRSKFSHKGSHGHLLLMVGEKGKAGAAILAARAAMRSGIGLLTLYINTAIYEIMQTAVPEAMCHIIEDELLQIADKKYATIGIGPGIGQSNEAKERLSLLLTQFNRPVVIDADGLNILASDQAMLKLLPKYSILTPHPGEFRRLVGPWKSDFEKIELQRQFAIKHQLIVIVKGSHTSISNIDGQVVFNSTGNHGMATAGSGDVLTGIIAGLLTQGYKCFEAGQLGVFLHGLAGDLALHKEHYNSLVASDIISHLGQAFKAIDQ